LIKAINWEALIALDVCSDFMANRHQGAIHHVYRRLVQMTFLASSDRKSLVQPILSYIEVFAEQESREEIKQAFQTLASLRGDQLDYCLRSFLDHQGISLGTGDPPAEKPQVQC